jgi:molybdopterin molybdotransferase
MSASTSAAGFPVGVTFDQACTIVDRIARAEAMPPERLALARAHGRILAQGVVAQVPLPPFTNSAMDGFAFRSDDLPLATISGLHWIGDHFAGGAQDCRIAPGQCVRVTTGAAIPDGADTVVMKESTRVVEARVFINDAPRPGAHVRHAGEDVHLGDRVLGPGMRLSPSRVALAASLGYAQLDVAQRPTVAVFTTGDELVEPGIALAPGQVYNSNRELLMGLLRADGLEPTAWPTLPDKPARLRSMLLDAASSFDLVITCGGVSAGEKDYLPALVQAEGAVHFWKVRMKPGMPLLFGRLGRARLLALPGNPVSVLATWLALGRPLLDGLQGSVERRPCWHARLAAGFDKHNTRREFLRGRGLPGADGVFAVRPNPADGSHRLAAAADSDVLIVLPEGERTFAIGDIVEVLPY